MQINLMPDYSLLAIMVIFIMTYWVVRKFFIEPINNVLETREHETKSAEQTYEEAMAAERAPTAAGEILGLRFRHRSEPLIGALQDRFVRLVRHAQRVTTGVTTFFPLCYTASALGKPPLNWPAAASSRL